MRGERRDIRHTNRRSGAVGPARVRLAVATPEGATRAALLRAAHEILVTQGPSALTVRGVAAGAQTSTMNLYSRFGGKDGVVDELYAQGFRLLHDALRAVTPSDDPIADVRRGAAAYRRFALDNPAYYSIMFQQPIADFEPSDAARAVAQDTLGELASRLRAAMADGTVPAADPIVTAISVWATCHGLVSLEVVATAPEGVDWDAIYASTVDALLAGLGPRRHTP
jgi:AcrR family transcriptional regulator